MAHLKAHQLVLLIPVLAEKIQRMTGELDSAERQRSSLSPEALKDHGLAEEFLEKHVQLLEELRDSYEEQRRRGLRLPSFDPWGEPDR